MKYFKIEELTRSTTAEKMDIPNVPNEQETKSLVNLVINVLDPVREYIGKPVYVNSGFRSEEVNKAVGGVSSSQHRKGQAADITRRNKSENKEIFDYIANNLDFDQLIDEKNYQWIHVSYNRDANRKQILHLK